MSEPVCGEKGVGDDISERVRNIETFVEREGERCKLKGVGGEEEDGREGARGAGTDLRRAGGGGTGDMIDAKI